MTGIEAFYQNTCVYKQITEATRDSGDMQITTGKKKHEDPSTFVLTTFSANEARVQSSNIYKRSDLTCVCVRVITYLCNTVIKYCTREALAKSALLSYNFLDV